MDCKNATENDFVSWLNERRRHPHQLVREMYSLEWANTEIGKLRAEVDRLQAANNELNAQAFKAMKRSAELEHHAEHGVETPEPETEWFMHVIGPDDIFPCLGQFDALRKANQHNRSWARLMADDPKPNDPYCVAVAATKKDI